ncbi:MULTISPECIES: hypothetical protein [Paraburkholderia]|nr:MULTISPECIES: hypothetical protein [Paraburkholderia]MCX4176662.1 hypothetical protein [Paraburkholderia madseniana]MDQ6464653.1 hypothetical protein [Paraburkholderia madseniana]
MGNQAMTDCANYVPGADPYQNQYCAAVNFLNNQCMQPTTGEKSILGNTGTTQGSASNCAGSYGAGQSQFGFADQETSNDNIFNPISNLGTNASGVMQQTCKSQAVVTQPAQYANNTCIVSRDAESDGCTQQLNVNASAANTPATLGQVGCVSPWITLYSGGGTTMGCLIVAADSKNLHTGDTYDGLIIFQKDSVDAYGHAEKDGWDGYDHEWQDWVNSYSGGNPSHCAGAGTPLNCFKEAFADAGFNHYTDTGIATEWYSTGQGYVCPTGATLSGSNCVAKTFTYNWTDNCGPLTGGAALPTPSQ